MGLTIEEKIRRIDELNDDKKDLERCLSGSFFDSTYLTNFKFHISMREDEELRNYIKRYYHNKLKKINEELNNLIK